MARPSEGLGSAFSCRLRMDMDEAARRDRDVDGTSLSHTVRRWLGEYFRLKDQANPTWLEQLSVEKQANIRLRNENKKLRDKLKVPKEWRDAASVTIPAGTELHLDDEPGKVELAAHG